MTIDDIIGKFLDDEALLGGGRPACREVVAQLSREGVTVHGSTVSNVQTILTRVLVIQRERAVISA